MKSRVKSAITTGKAAGPDSEGTNFRKARIARAWAANCRAGGRPFEAGLNFRMAHSLRFFVKGAGFRLGGKWAGGARFEKSLNFRVAAPPRVADPLRRV